MRNTLFAAMLLGSFAAADVGAAVFDVADPVAYETASRTLAESLRETITAKAGSELRLRNDLLLHGREMPLREVCTACATQAEALGLDDSFEPGVWLYQPAKGGAAGSALIAFPPAGDDSTWTQVDALTADGRWVQLDAKVAPKVPVYVVRVNGALSFERQVEKANASLRAAGLQAPPVARSKSTPTTRLESIRLSDDKEPWVSGAAEIYALTIGLQPANQPQIGLIEMPYLDHDGRYYYPRQVMLYWQDFAYGAADILLYEHDDNTNYQTLVQAIITAVGEGGELAGEPQLAAIAEIVNRVVAAMPSGWFANDDDYVDSIHTVLKTVGETRYGAAGNARVSYIPFQLPSN
jgi:hypothetical protein